MSSYNHFFAELYDKLTYNIKYRSGSNFISGFFGENGIESGVILDLGCGTCSVSCYLAEMGYDIIGVDTSADMLEIASNKFSETGCNFSLMNMKMQNLSLSQQVDACISTLDAINHLDNAAEVASVFALVYKSLKNGGMFIFDVNTEYKHNVILADNTFVFDEDGFFLSWDNELTDDGRVRILLDFFIFNGINYDRYSEEFYERAYNADLIKDMLKDAGFNDVSIYADFDKNPPADTSERLFFVCKKE